MATPRLTLRPKQSVDAVAVEALGANPAIAPNLCSTAPHDAARTLVIAELRSTRIVGAASYGVTGLGSGMEMTLWIGEPYWGRGYATEAAHALIDQAFADTSIETLWCAIRVTNARARRVIEKCGFQYRGSGMVRLTGRGAFPIERFALDRRNWASLRSWGASRAGGDSGNAPRETAA
jgi:RimJ/RimL family protein N-acetyltransferase